MSLFGALTNAVSSISQNVFNTARDVHTTATRAVSSIYQNVSTTARNVQSTATHAVSAISQNVSNVVRNVQSSATQGITAVSKNVAGAVQNISTAAASTVSSFSRNIRSTTTQAATAITKTATDTATAITSTPGRVAATATAAANAIIAPVTVENTATTTANPVTVRNATPTKNPVESITTAATTATGTVSSIADQVIDKRDEMYAGEPVEKVAAIGSDVLIPLDLMNVVNKTVTGRGEQLTTEDYVGAAIDTASIILGVFTGGVGYVGLKAAKTGVKGVTKMVPKISKNSKLKTPMPRKAAPKKVSAPKKVTKKTTNKPAPSIKSRGTTRKVNRRTARATKKTVAPARVNTVKKSTVKNTKAKAAKATSSKPKVTKAKTPAAAAPPRGILGTLTDLSSIALTGLMAWMMLGPSEEEVYDDGYYDDGLYDDGYGTSEDSGLLPAEEPYYDETGEEYYDSPILPEELQPLEEYAEDLSGYIEDVPVIGDIAEEARKRGLSLPFLIAIGAVAFIGGRWVWKKYKASKKHPAKKPAAATKKPVAGRKSAAGKKRGTAA